MHLQEAVLSHDVHVLGSGIVDGLLTSSDCVRTASQIVHAGKKGASVERMVSNACRENRRDAKGRIAQLMHSSLL